MDLDECEKKGYIKITNIDKELIRSLIEMSDNNEATVNSVNLTEKNISPYLSMAYESLRQSLEALSISKGYKVTNHICLGELIKRLFPDFDFIGFDRFRYIRNGINYYGTKVELNQGKEIICKILSLKRIVQKQYLKDFI